MGGSFKIGRLFGIDVKVHWTYFLLVAFFAFLSSCTPESAPESNPESTPAKAAVWLSLCRSLRDATRRDHKTARIPDPTLASSNTARG